MFSSQFIFSNASNAFIQYSCKPIICPSHQWINGKLRKGVRSLLIWVFCYEMRVTTKLYTGKPMIWFEKFWLKIQISISYERRHHHTHTHWIWLKFNSHAMDGNNVEGNTHTHRQRRWRREWWRWLWWQWWLQLTHDVLFIWIVNLNMLTIQWLGKQPQIIQVPLIERKHLN